MGTQPVCSTEPPLRWHLRFNGCQAATILKSVTFEPGARDFPFALDLENYAAGPERDSINLSDSIRVETENCWEDHREGMGTPSFCLAQRS